MKNPDKYTFKYTYSQFGEKLSSTDALGNTISYGYDNAGRLVKVTMPDAWRAVQRSETTSPTKETVSYGYYKTGR